MGKNSNRKIRIMTVRRLLREEKVKMEKARRRVLSYTNELEQLHKEVPVESVEVSGEE